MPIFNQAPGSAMPSGGAPPDQAAMYQQAMQQRQAKMAQAEAASRAAGAPPPGPGVGDPNAARYMAARNQAMSAERAAMPKGPPPQIRPMGMPAGGQKGPPPAMGGAFGMKPAAPPRSAFAGGMTKAPMQAGRANPFAGGGGGIQKRGGNR